jgi:hypothetical protein
MYLCYYVVKIILMRKTQKIEIQILLYKFFYYFAFVSINQDKSMKITFIFTIVLLLHTIVFAQNRPEIVHFKKLSKEKYDERVKEYPHFDVIEFAEIKSEDEKFKIMDKEWHNLWENFIAFYHSKGLYPSKKQVVDLCLYFNGEGHLDHFAYHFKKESDFSRQFIQYFEEYMKTHTFGLKPKVKFSQCGQIELLPKNN